MIRTTVPKAGPSEARGGEVLRASPRASEVSVCRISCSCPGCCSGGAKEPGAVALCSGVTSLGLFSGLFWGFF